MGTLNVAVTLEDHGQKLQALEIRNSRIVQTLRGVLLDGRTQHVKGAKVVNETLKKGDYIAIQGKYSVSLMRYPVASVRPLPDADTRIAIGPVDVT